MRLLSNPTTLHFAALVWPHPRHRDTHWPCEYNLQQEINISVLKQCSSTFCSNGFAHKHYEAKVYVGREDSTGHVGRGLQRGWDLPSQTDDWQLVLEILLIISPRRYVQNSDKKKLICRCVLMKTIIYFFKFEIFLLVTKQLEVNRNKNALIIISCEMFAWFTIFFLIYMQTSW